MKLTYRLGLLLLVFVGLWHPLHSTSAQTPAVPTPHLAYGESLEVTLNSTISTAIWLNVVQGDTFTIRMQGATNISQRVNFAPAVEGIPFNWRQSEQAGAWVLVADGPGPYLWTLTGDGTATLTLTLGDTLSTDRGSIAIGDTVTGTGADMQVDAYSIDLSADTTMTVHLQSDGRAALPVLLIPGLGDALQVDRYGDGGYSQYYVIPAELAGHYQILVRMNSGNYTLNVVAGNDLWLDKGTLTPDTPISGTGTVGYSDRYEFQAESGDVVTFLLDSPAGFDAYIEPRSANGDYFSRVENDSTAGGYFATYQIDEAGPYYVYVQTNTEYTLSMLQGPYLEGVPSVKAGDTLAITDTTATRYVLEAIDGDWVTIQTTAADGTSDYRIEMNDAAGNAIYALAERRDTTQGIYQALFHLSGPAPYQIEISATGPYNLNVTAGDALRTVAGEISVGQRVEVSAEMGQTLVYTLPNTEIGQAVAILTTGLSNFRVLDVNGQHVEYFYFNFVATPNSNQGAYVAYQLDGLCPCQLQLVTSQPTYSLELTPIAPDVFPDPQPLNLGEAVTGDTGAALMVPYTFEASGDQDLVVRLEYDPAQTDGTRLYLEIQAPGEEKPTYLLLDYIRTELGDGYIVQHYPLYFPGTYTLRIKNLVGPYTLTVE